MMTSLKKILLLCTLLLNPLHAAKTILFDIHGVLLYENISGAVKKKVMDKLTAAEQEKASRGLRDAKEYKKLCALYDDYKVMADHPPLAYPEDAHLPYETYALFAGHISPDDLYELTKRMLIQGAIDNKFESHMEQIIITAMIETVFEREQLLEAVTPLSEGHALIEYFATNSNHDVAIFSNAPQEWVDVYLTHQPFAHIFDHVATEKVLTSGGLQKLKPEAPAFEAACKALGCAPEEVILIDDTPENVEGARAFGMKAVYFDHNEIERVIEELKELGVCSDESAPRLERLLGTQRSVEPEYEPFFFVS
jgi:FMN phosphatase YigB (HAD superfamily)